MCCVSLLPGVFLNVRHLFPTLNNSIYLFNTATLCQSSFASLLINTNTRLWFQALSDTFINNSSSDCHHALQLSLQLPSSSSFHLFNACTILVLLTCPSPSHVSTRLLIMFYSHEGKPCVLNFHYFSNSIAHSSHLAQARCSDSLVSESHFTSPKHTSNHFSKARSNTRLEIHTQESGPQRDLRSQHSQSMSDYCVT
jgi:hypothetical protein